MCRVFVSGPRSGSGAICGSEASAAVGQIAPRSRCEREGEGWGEKGGGERGEEEEREGSGGREWREEIEKKCGMRTERDGE